MARYLLVPFVDRDLLRSLLARLDQIKGYPRVHTLDDPIVQVGAAFRGWTTPPYTETLFAVQIHDTTGPLALRRVIAVTVDDLATALAERYIAHLGVRKRLREWVADRGWKLVTTLPEGDLDPSPWSPVPVRDGAAGSADGVPIKDGDE